MSSILWTTDIHLNFVTTDQLVKFVTDIQKQEPDLLLIGGDIGESRSVSKYLKTLAKALQIPIYFVLGNHDYYGGSIADVRRRIKQLSDSSKHLFWLPETGIVKLSDSTALIGHGCWGDAYDGDFLSSTVALNDYRIIGELKPLEGISLQLKLHDLGDEAATFIESLLRNAINDYQTVYLLTHVPPFREACVHRGNMSDDNWAPHFVCKAVGDMLMDVMSSRPDRHLVVLSGHSHGGCSVKIAPNITARNIEVEYKNPPIGHLIEVD